MVHCMWVFLHVTNLRHVLSKFQFNVNTLYNTILNENSKAKLVSVQNVEAIYFQNCGTIASFLKAKKLIGNVWEFYMPVMTQFHACKSPYIF